MRGAYGSSVALACAAGADGMGTGVTQRERGRRAFMVPIRLAAGREPVDADSLSADSRAHRATRVASDVIELVAQAESQGRRGECPRGGWSGPEALEGYGISGAGRENEPCHRSRMGSMGGLGVTLPLASVKQGKEDGAIAQIPVYVIYAPGSAHAIVALRCGDNTSLREDTDA